MATQTKLKLNIIGKKSKPNFGAVIIHNTKDKLADATILGRTFVDWVSFACGELPHKVIKTEEKINVIDFLKGKVDKTYDYLIVLYSSAPLMTEDTIKEIVEYASIKGISLCKLPVGYVIKVADYISGMIQIDSVYSRNIEDFYVVENKKQLNHAIEVLQERINNFHMNNGVEIKKPKSVYIEPMVDIEDGVIIYPNNSLKGETYISSSVILKENNVIENSKIGANSCISGSVINKSIIGDNVYISSFCEIDNSLVGRDTLIDKGSLIKNYNIRPNEKIKANSILGETNDSNSGAGQSR